MHAKSHSLLIRNGQVLMSDGSLDTAAALIRAGQNVDIILDAAGNYVLPGLIDIHTHGIGEDSAVGSLLHYAAREAGAGATTFFPALFGPPNETCAHLQRHLRETDNLRRVPQAGGFRLESPHLADPSAGLPRDCAPISDALTDQLLHYALLA